MKKILLLTITTALLSFQFAANAQNWLIAGNSNITTSQFLGTTNNQPLIVKTNKAERLRVLGNGNVGIGTATPVARLEVFNGSMQITNTTSSANLIINRANSLAGTSNQILFADNKVNKWAVGGTNIGSAGSNNLSFYNYTLGANAFTILNSNNNIGVGTTVPGDKISIKGGAISFQHPNNDVPYVGIDYDPSSDAMRFRANLSSTALNTSLLTLNRVTGNLGIGTTDPGTYKLKISHGGSGLDIEYANTHDDWELFTVSDLNLFFNGGIRGSFNSTTGAYTAKSDERLKTNIKPMSTMLDKIKQLKPSTYQFKNTSDKQQYNGFIAQDVMKIFPTLVVHNVIPERKVDVYTMDYSGFGVLAIKGIQELAPIIEEQKATIKTLEERINKLEAALAVITANKNENISNIITSASLQQNQPNPFNKSTIIRYSIPQGSKGQINIYDQTGKLAKALNTNDSGQSELNGNDLAAGAYTYTLMVNGKISLSKRMLVIR